MTWRHRCTACGNLTRFDVTATRRTQEFHHYTIGGDMTVEESELLEERLDEVICRWCGARDEMIEVLEHNPSARPHRDRASKDG